MKKYSWVLAVLLVVLVVSFGAVAQSYTTAKFTSKAPKIDGVLDDEIWGQIEPNSDFVDTAGREPDVKTEFKVAWDRDYLYVAIKNHVDTSNLTKNITADGGATWEDDENSVFINPNYPDLISFLQYSFNSIPVRNGLQYGGAVLPEYDMWEVAINEADDYYTAEVAISFESTLMWPEVGDEWGFNIGRGCTSTANSYSWSVLQAGTFIDVTTLGVIEFVR